MWNSSPSYSTQILSARVGEVEALDSDAVRRTPTNCGSGAGSPSSWIASRVKDSPGTRRGGRRAARAPEPGPRRAAPVPTRQLVRQLSRTSWPCARARASSAASASVAAKPTRQVEGRAERRRHLHSSDLHDVARPKVALATTHAASVVRACTHGGRRPRGRAPTRPPTGSRASTPHSHAAVRSTITACGVRTSAAAWARSSSVSGVIGWHVDVGQHPTDARRLGRQLVAAATG